MDKAFEAYPQKYIRYKHLIAQYESKDGILKDTLFVRTRDDLDKETSWEIRYGLLQYVQDATLMVSDSYGLEEFFQSFLDVWAAYALLISTMILFLAFFMMIVSFS